MGIDQRAEGVKPPERIVRPGPRSPEPLKGRLYIALDTESTGIEADTGEVIEIAAVKFRLEPGGKARVLDRWETYVRPKNPIPYKITHLTGIKQSDVQNAPFFHQIEERLRNFLADFPIVGHSIESDVNFLARSNFEVKNLALDTFELATLMLPQLANYSLVAVAGALKINAAGSHRAMADTIMAMEVFANLAGKIEELEPDILKEINQIGNELPNWGLKQLFIEAAQNQQKGSALTLGTGGLGNLGDKLKQQLAAKSGFKAAGNLDFMLLIPHEPPKPLVPEPEINIPLESHGPRVGHIAASINQAFEEGKHLLLETPGPEKERGLGVLLAGIKKAVQEGKSIVIAVSSEAQRERLTARLLPQLETELGLLKDPKDPFEGRGKKRRASEKPLFTSVTVKPRANYLCARRWELFRKKKALTPEERKILIRILAWLPNSEVGDSAELRINNQDRLWSQVNSQKELCPENSCLEGGKCFFQRARERARGSHLIIVDQGLVLADLQGMGGTLPDYDYLIIDEAHTFEDEAGKQFGSVITPNTLFDYLDWISRPITWTLPGGFNGFIHEISNSIKENGSTATREALAGFIEQVHSQVNLTRNSTGVFLQELTNTLQQRNQETGQGDGRIKLDQRFLAGNLWNELAGPWEGFKLSWEELYYLMRDLRNECQSFSPDLESFETLKLELDYYVNSADRFLNQLTDAFEGGDYSNVHWLANHPRTGLVSVFCQPLQIGPALNKHLFSKKKSVVLASSTLTTDGDFSFIKERLGLNNYETLEMRLPPERDYSGLMMFLPTDMPEPNQPNYQKYIDQNVLELARNSTGRVLVLFSSNSALRPVSYTHLTLPTT